MTKIRLSHNLTTDDALALYADTYRHHYNRIPLFSLLDKIHDDTTDGKKFALVPTMRHWGMHGHEHLRCAIVLGGEVLAFIDNSYTAIEQVCAWTKGQLSSLPSDGPMPSVASAVGAAVAAVNLDRE